METSGDMANAVPNPVPERGCIFEFIHRKFAFLSSSMQATYHSPTVVPPDLIQTALAPAVTTQARRMLVQDVRISLYVHQLPKGKIQVSCL